MGRGGAHTGATPEQGGYDVGKDGESTTFNGQTAGGGGQVDLVVLQAPFQDHSRMEAVVAITVQVVAAVPMAAVAALVAAVLIWW